MGKVKCHVLLQNAQMLFSHAFKGSNQPCHCQQWEATAAQPFGIGMNQYNFIMNSRTYKHFRYNGPVRCMSRIISSRTRPCSCQLASSTRTTSNRTIFSKHLQDNRLREPFSNCLKLMNYRLFKVAEAPTEPWRLAASFTKALQLLPIHHI